MDKILIGLVLVAIILGARGSGQSISQTESGVLVETSISEQIQSTGEKQLPPAPVSTKNPLGEEGSIQVSQTGQGAVSLSEGEIKNITGIAITAKGSQIYVERVRVELGTSRNIWLGLIKTLFIVDGSGNVLAKTDLNRNTVSVTNGVSFATLAGFNYAIQKNQTGYLYIRAETYPLVDSGDGASFTIAIPREGVRARDDRGASIYAPTSPFSTTLTHRVK